MKWVAVIGRNRRWVDADGQARMYRLNPEVMGDYLRKDAILCTDSATPYKSFAQQNNINHEVINVRKDGYVKKGIYHIQHVNRYQGELKYWLKRFTV